MRFELNTTPFFCLYLNGEVGTAVARVMRFRWDTGSECVCLCTVDLAAKCVMLFVLQFPYVCVAHFTSNELLSQLT